LITGPILLSALDQSALAGASFQLGFGIFILCLLRLALLSIGRAARRTSSVRCCGQHPGLVVFGGLLI
jgi:hypothetical protein